MIHDFELSPGKKKAILIWELFFRDNYVYPPSAASCVMFNDTDRADFWVFEKNVESDGGVTRAAIEAIRGRIAAIIVSYQSAAGLGKWARFASSGSRKIAVVDPGFAGLFAPIKTYLAQPRMLDDIGKKDAGANLENANDVRSCLSALARVVKAAEFNLNDLGLAIFKLG